MPPLPSFMLLSSQPSLLVACLLYRYLGDGLFWDDCSHGPRRPEKQGFLFHWTLKVQSAHRWFLAWALPPPTPPVSPMASLSLSSSEFFQEGIRYWYLCLPNSKEPWPSHPSSFLESSYLDQGEREAHLPQMWGGAMYLFQDNSLWGRVSQR